MDAKETGIGSRITDLMRALSPRITQETLAEKIGISRSSLVLKLSGERSFNYMEVDRIAHVLDVHPAALVFDFGDPVAASIVLKALDADPDAFQVMVQYKEELGQVADMIRDAEDPSALIAGLRFALSMYKKK